MSASDGQGDGPKKKVGIFNCDGPFDWRPEPSFKLVRTFGKQGLNIILFRVLCSVGENTKELSKKHDKGFIRLPFLLKRKTVMKSKWVKCGTWFTKIRESESPSDAVSRARDVLSVQSSSPSASPPSPSAKNALATSPVPAIAIDSDTELED